MKVRSHFDINKRYLSECNVNIIYCCMALKQSGGQWYRHMDRCMAEPWERKDRIVRKRDNDLTAVQWRLHAPLLSYHQVPLYCYPTTYKSWSKMATRIGGIICGPGLLWAPRKKIIWNEWSKKAMGDKARFAYHMLSKVLLPQQVGSSVCSKYNARHFILCLP